MRLLCIGLMLKFVSRAPRFRSRAPRAVVSLRHQREAVGGEEQAKVGSL